MSLSEDIDRICTQYKSDNLIIKEFVLTIYASLTDLRIMMEQNKTKMNQEDLKALRDVSNAIRDAMARKGQTIKVSTSKNVTTIVLKVAYSVKSKGCLAEMSLSYLIAHHEAFIKDFFVTIFKLKAAFLRSTKSMTFEEILKFKSTDSLREHMAERETESIGYGSIDDLSSYLARKFNMDPTEESFWPRLREASYRRNLIIHNRSVVNDIYRRKVDAEAPLRSRLSTDDAYVSEAADAVSAFIDYIQQNMSRKLKLRKPRRRGRG